MATDLRIGVAGATGAVGAEIIRVLDRASWRPDTLVPLARPTTGKSHVDYGDDRVPVDDVADEALEGLDGLILALPEEDARSVGLQALDEGVPVVDVSGGLLGESDLPMVVPWINPERLLEAPTAGVLLPGSAALLVASALGPLARAGFAGAVSATVLLPASSWGRDGVDELAAQVRALFNADAPPRKVFDQGLAFDLLPQVGSLLPEGNTDMERRAIEDLGRLVGVDPDLVDVTMVGVPVFSGLSAVVTLHLGRHVDAALVERVLVDGGVVKRPSEAPRDLPRPRKVEGQPFAHLGRVRTSPDGAVRLWLAMDNLRTIATAAVASAATLLGVGRTTAEA